jgi:hypothetical protein
MDYLKELGEDIKEVMVEQWELQGHRMDKSRFVSELECEIEEDREVTHLRFYGVVYGKYINQGVSAANIPFGRRTGARRSKYIQGLIKYVERRMGVSGREGVSIAFAIANKHKEEGMPTPASAKFSQTGKRTGWLDEALEAGRDKIDRAVNKHAYNYFFNKLI